MVLYVLVYVDDKIINGIRHISIDGFFGDLDSKFSFKDLGKLSYFLGIELSYTSTGLFLSQRKYIDDLLRKNYMYQAKGNPTRMVTSCWSAYVNSPMEDESSYRSIMGALQYVVITRPDIAFAVNKVCQLMHRPFR
ncbi:uncharacterized mitochondrial protein AtMg00810-like [Gossypium arboreum]|uniref:uncharacterized mitochondrial protein AtMg00810-like n=1 Tax=Gossypium arboreum TaxID=29729 RepID=UPI0022F1D95B|nr:uncharacterized mitochondrial protein AtMg00810-like [Gossypium arboreum]